MKRIVLTGAESSGKSTLTEQLSQWLDLPFASEYARVYLTQHGPDYDLEELIRLSVLHQHYQQLQVPPTLPLGIFDTDLINYKIWTEVVFGQCPKLIADALAEETSHVYLLCKPDIPWAADPLREHPRADDRHRLFQRHLTEIQRLNRPYEIIDGIGHQRLINAKAALKRLL
ncbi:ATP-binding protein [Amphritea sp. 1_MG-2023]|uniref:ATP-binding protein n=1 Tax=Amphritea sp. 1_MG-2023 TaxID=3062670 RepID=UPI0026E2A1E0|nr:ATP-binding protein [Amphritea sp. 1_MG-2023]MDO6563616.1 ATP-binding protein [Amphritea sp. 1_MG-2023]